MVSKLRFPSCFTFYYLVLLVVLFLYPKNINAQCAGNDNVMLTVCDIPNVTSQTINLFSELGGTPTAGGTWKDDDKSGGLNKNTGILNAQQIKKGGIYHYTYTVTGVNGCADNTATVTVTIGGYIGVPGPNSSICNTETSYNLFQVFNGNFLAPQIGGTWNDDDHSGGLNLTAGTLDASIPIPDKTYSYTYRIPAVGTCPAPNPVTIAVSIYRSPKPGSPLNLFLCSNQLNSYTNLDLNSRLTGEDAGGTWSEIGTSEISDDDDSVINVQNIYYTKGPGSYSFTYTVVSNNTVCVDQSSTVIITIEKQLDFTGAALTVNSDICENDIPTATYNAVLTQGIQSIANGSYNVTYTISGVAAPITTTQSFSGGILRFPISSAYFQQAQDYTVKITDIKDASSLGICNNIIGTIQDVLHIYPIPKINSATLAITPICQTFDATVNFSGTSNLANGSYNILYNISGSNTATAIASVLNITGGAGSFSIPKALIPNAGASTITITKITNTVTGCSNSSTLSKSFTVNPLPDASNLTTVIKDVCQGQPATIQLSGLGTLTSISIDYTLSGVNVLGSQTLPLTVVAGAVNFVIPVANLSNVGLTSFTITNLTNTITGCSLAISKKTDFSVNPLPNIPVAVDVQPFCSSQNATVANLLPQGAQYQWLDTATSTVPLASTTPLTAKDYFVKEVNITTGCESGLKKITAVINPTPQINSAVVTIASICQGFNANVTFTAGTTNLTDGNYDIIYSLSGSNTATAITAVLNVTGGVPAFTINASLIPNAGNTTIAITSITNSLTHCSNTSTLSKVFTINAIPDVSNMTVTVKDGCLGQDATVDVSGLVNLNNITLTYSVSGANTIATQTIPLAVISGKASFTILGTVLSAVGSNTLLITAITNQGNSCSAVMSPVSKNFSINTVPANPTAVNQEFCETDFATVTSLKPNGNQYNWYSTATTTAPLPLNTLLVTGNYFVKEHTITTGCESVATPISVLVKTVSVPVLIPNGNEFCGIQKPTIQNLSNNTTASGNLNWYDALTNGNLLPSTELLSEGATYYGFNYDTAKKCSSSALTATVTLTNCSISPDKLKIPDGFSPNGDGVNDTFQIIDIEYSFPNYTLEIYNRYGNIMFKGDINKPSWDGKNSNSSFISGDAPAGVYFYIINYNKDNLSPRQGQLYLNR